MPWASPPELLILWARFCIFRRHLGNSNGHLQHCADVMSSICRKPGVKQTLRTDQGKQNSLEGLKREQRSLSHGMRKKNPPSPSTGKKASRRVVFQCHRGICHLMFSVYYILFSSKEDMPVVHVIPSSSKRWHRVRVMGSFICGLG